MRNSETNIITYIIDKEMTEERLRLIVNMTYILIDMADGYCDEIESAFKRDGNYRYEDKHDIKKMKFYAKKLVKSVDKTLKDETKQQEFGEASDFFKTVFESVAHITTEEQMMQFLAAAKLIVKPVKEDICTNTSQVIL